MKKETKKGKEVYIPLKDIKKNNKEILMSKGNEEILSPLKSVLAEGENYLRQSRRVETKVFDDTFIEKMEDGVDAISKIISNPRTFIREEEELVEAGLANKITTLSIQHFASHTQFIRNVDEDGNVIPEKILTIFTETDTAIYENRFVMTLIKKCLSFINTRYKYILEHIETFDSDLLLVHNKSTIGGVTYEVDSRIKVSKPMETEEESARNKALLDRLSELRNRCSYFIRSPFMTQMKGAKEVANPIHLTNLLRKHPDYHRAYLLWGFLDKYEELGISFDVKEYDKKFSSDYKEEISNYIASSVLLLRSDDDNVKLPSPSRVKKYNPSVIFTLEDETYADGKYIYDHYPLSYKKDDPLPPLPEEVRLKDEELKKRVEAMKAVKGKVEEDILEAKDLEVYKEVKKRKEREKALLDIIEALEKENKELKKKIESKK